MTASSPECFGGFCEMCDSDACGCECHFDGYGENYDPDICEFCGDWTPCDCDIQIMQDMEDYYYEDPGGER